MARKEKGTAMVAPPPTDDKLHPVEDMARQRGMQPHTLAALRIATGWAEGKQVTAAEFDAAAARFDRRPMGGGRI